MRTPPQLQFSKPSAHWPLGLLCGSLLGLLAASAQEAPPAKMSLSDVLERAVKSDRTVAIADYEVRKAIVEALRPYTRIAPSLSLGADANWQGNRNRDLANEPVESNSAAPAATGTTAPVEALVPRLVRERRWTRSDSNNQSLGLNLSQPILDLTVGPARRQSLLLKEISQWELRQRLREVFFEITAQYVEILRQTQLVIENKKTLGLTTEQVRLAEGRLKAQEVIESDVLQARVSDEQARRAVMEAEISRDLAKTKLAVMLDFLPTVAFTLTNLNAGKIAATTVGESLSLARQNREEIRVARLTMNRTQAEREEIFARYAPTMDLQFGGDLSTGSNIDRRDSWNAGVSFSWAIFDRGQRKLDLKSNALQIEQDGLRIENAARVVSNDAVESWYGLERNRLRLASLEIERKAAEANFDVQQGKYKAGLATALEVQTALRDLARVRIESVSASFSLELSYHDLENVLALYESSRVDATLRRLTVPAPLKTNPTPQPPKP